MPENGQPTLWDSEELDRLAYLRQLAIDTGAPPAALRVIDTAANVDDAMTRMAEAGLMPTEEESLEGLLSWFAPLLEPHCDQLEAEICGAEFIGELRMASPAPDDIPEALRSLVLSLKDHRGQEALAMMRVLSVVGPPDVRMMAAHAASQMILAGLADLPWAHGLGSPRPGRCFGYADIYGEQRSLVVTFSYGRDKHAFVVLIDYLLGGGVKDCYIADYNERLRNQYRNVGRDPELRFSDLTGMRARSILEQALASEPCPSDPDQIEDVVDYLDLLRARVELLPAAGASATATKLAAAKPAATKPTAAKNVHRIKVALRGTKPPTWRRFDVPSDSSLHQLHRVIQIGFGWPDDQQFVFRTPDGQYGIPDPAARSATHKKLSAVADWPGDRIKYACGDSLEFDILVEAVQPAEPGVCYPRCIAARNGNPVSTAAADLGAVNQALAPMAKVLVKQSPGTRRTGP